MSEWLREVRAAAADAEARFRQGDRRACALGALVTSIRTDEPVTLAAPLVVPLAWSEALARAWACDCVERVVSLVRAADEYDLLVAAIDRARRFARGEVGDAMLDATFVDLHAQPWGDYDGCAPEVVRAVCFAVARDAAIESVWADEITPGCWAADAARAAVDAASAAAGAAAGAAERAYQTERLGAYLTGAV